MARAETVVFSLLRFLLLAALCVLSPLLHAAASIEPDAVRFQNYDVAQGLFHGRVRAIAQDRAGHIWIATRDGLNRFDGRSFRVYRHDRTDPHSLPDNVVMSLATTADGTLWLGTAGAGLARYDAERDRFVSYRAGAATQLAGDYIRTLHADPSGDLWVGSFGVAVQRFDPQRGLARDLSLGRPPSLQRVHRVINAPDGSVLFVAVTNVLRWDLHSDVLKPLLPEQVDGITPNTEWALLDRDGQLWVGLLDGGLLRVSLDGQVLAHYRAGATGALRSGEVRGLLQTRAGEIWIGTSGGVARYDRAGDRFVEIRHDDSDPTSPPADVYVLFEDRDGLIWGGSSGQGIGVHDPASEAVTVYHRRSTDPNSLPGSAVQAVLAAADGSLWIGLARDGGLVHFRPGQGVLAHYRHDADDPASLASNAISALAQARDGALWVGLDAHGVDRLEPGARSFRHFRRTAADARAVPGNLINELYVDVDDTLWVGSDGGGLGSLCGKCNEFTNYTLPADDGFDLSVATVTSIAETPDRAIWFGLFGGGVARLDGDRRSLRRYAGSRVPGAGPGSDVVRSLLATRDGGLWLGSSAGLDRVTYDPATTSARFDAQRWPADEGSRNLVCMTEDGAGQLWLGATDGLLRLDPADGQGARRIGLLNALDRRGYSSNACRYRGGQVYLGSPAGLVVFAPERLPPAPDMGPLVLNELLLFNQPVRPQPDVADAVLQRTLAYTERLRLNHAQSVFGFDFAALDYRAGARVNYRYRLDGLHQDWIPVLPDQHSVTFSGVPAGSYRFRVQAQREDGTPRETGIAVEITPAPWRSNWAYASYGLLVLLGLFALMRRNQRRLAYARHVAATIQRSEEALRKLNDELEMRVLLRTEDVSRSNRELQATLDQLREAQHQLVEAEKLASLGGLVAGIAHEINTPLGVCLTAASHLQQQSALLRTRLASGELRRSELLQFQQAACEGSDMILRNLQRADRLVRSFKQTAVDQSTDEWRRFDLEQSVRDTLTMLGPVLRTTPHRLEIVCAAPVEVHSSPGALYQIVSNLVLNAMQHAFAAGTAGTIRIAISAAAGQVQLSVGDDGRGMDEAERLRVFDPFFTTRRSEGGSGLGLHIVYNLVSQVLHGRISCSSAPGQGTRFDIVWDAG